MYLENANNEGYLKETDSSTVVKLRVLSGNNTPVNLSKFERIEVVIGVEEGRILTKSPKLANKRGELSFRLDVGDLLPYGENLLEVHLYEGDALSSRKHVVPSQGYYILNIQKPIDGVGPTVTTYTLDYLIERIGEIEDGFEARTNTAVTNAETAVTQASTAVTQANNAVDRAEEYLELAEGFSNIANEALAKSDTAITSSQNAVIKSNEALTKSNQSDTKSTEALDTANYVQSQLDAVISEGDSNAEVVQARIGYASLRERLDEQYMNAESQLLQINKLKESQESAALGVELLSSNEWTVGNGWTGDFTNGFTHTVGNVEPLEFPIAVEAYKLYEVEFTVESTDADHGFKLNVTVGDSHPFEIYRGAGNSITYRNGIEAIGTGGLKIIPKSDFVGTVKNISMREIIGIIEPTSTVTDYNSEIVNETRITKRSNNNLFLGKLSGARNTSGYSNASVGHESMSRNTSGYFNTSFGYRALLSNTVGSRNVALAYAALQDNISGHRNIAVGTFALNRNTHGHNNIGIGADTLWYNTVGSHNIAMGLTAQEHNLTGTGNIGIGYRTLLDNTANNFMVAIGYDSGKRLKSDNSVAIGAWSAENATTARDLVAIGGYASRTLVNGERVTSIGAFSGSGSTGSRNTFIGYSAGSGLTSGSDNIFIGASSTAYNSSLSYYLNIGNSIYGDLANQTLGIGIQTPTANLHIKANTAARPLLKFDKGVLTANTHSGGLEYDGTDIYFTTSSEGVRRKFLFDRPTIGLGVSNPTARLHIGSGNESRPAMKLEPSAVLTTTKHSGGFEYDGSELYFTKADGVRYKITMEATS